MCRTACRPAKAADCLFATLLLCGVQDGASGRDGPPASSRSRGGRGREGRMQGSPYAAPYRPREGMGTPVATGMGAAAESPVAQEARTAVS